MWRIRYALCISLLVIFEIKAECKDPGWCSSAGKRLCGTLQFVRNSCKTMCGTCREVFCQSVSRPVNADIQLMTKPPYQVGATVNFTCDPGYQRIGPATITCLKNGKWSDSPPYCTARSCGMDLTKVEPGRSCGRTCIWDSDCKGYLSKCRCDDWCGKSCVNPNSECPKLINPEKGYVNGNGRTFGKAVTYGCDKGFTLVGPSTRKCRSDRKWSGDAPLCVPYGACGQNGDLAQSWVGGKVIKGTNAKEGAWPWQALLIDSDGHSIARIFDSRSGFGGGSIINEEWILSAAHVVTDTSSRHLKANVWDDSFLIVLGMTAYPKKELGIPEHIQLYEPDAVYIHPRYDSKSFDYDVTMIRVGKRLKPGQRGVFIPDGLYPEKRITFSRHVRPVCLPCMNGDRFGDVDILKNFDRSNCYAEGERLYPKHADVGSAVMVTGFGVKNHDTERHPDTLQQGLLKLLNDSKCVESIRHIKREFPVSRFTNRMFCASGGNEKYKIDSCEGDSGGPVVRKVGEGSNNYWMQLGIVSWGVDCAGRHPGFYISVPSVINWIVKILEKPNTDHPGPQPGNNDNNKDPSTTAATTSEEFDSNEENDEMTTESETTEEFTSTLVPDASDETTAAGRF